MASSKSELHICSPESDHKASITSDEESLEEIYKLDYETEPIASGGEVLKAGYHVYFWCGVYQHHGIILDTSTWNSDNFILVAEFTNAALMGTSDFVQSSSTASGAISKGVDGGFRIVREFNPIQWHVVKYQATPVETVTWRPGTCSSATPSPKGTILSRVQFLHDCKHLIPPYHLLACNCETIAVWCTTGKWETLQGTGFYNVSRVGALAAAGVLAVPVGLAAGGLAAWHQFQINSMWENTAKTMNREFDWYTMGKKPNFRSLRNLLKQI